MADTAVALASANVQIVSRKVIGRLDSVRHGNCFSFSLFYTKLHNIAHSTSLNKDFQSKIVRLLVYFN